MPFTPQTDALIDEALASAGLRRTAATLALARLFTQGDDPVLSHAEVQDALAGEGAAVDRVTVYRLLDRFVAAGLLRRAVDAQRVSRFSLAVTAPEGEAVPRFECDDCHRQFRLDDGADKLGAAARQVLKALEAAGHEGHSVEVAVHGRCAGCATEAQPRGSR
ncbi:Fur family transcriptional regulator [Ramlibacter tataouinensis]|uniref:Transcriptional regulator, Fur family-like protein n=1 Tax=Ramlibacter tataouinensis (strain ATCC BAA-407 / DSM 14655 / LMG 21543 / TTB310) TaxID=365046 RepID=F5XW24_RAMTT|nr:transcriptional repressor [Ramlibacter tataouinensis]AEG94127.1 transcriptional regulator, Fur family-like protein [Ramlibacter tataouinensis TTB310]